MGKKKLFPGRIMPETDFRGHLSVSDNFETAILKKQQANRVGYLAQNSWWGLQEKRAFFHMALPRRKEGGKKSRKVPRYSQAFSIRAAAVTEIFPLCFCNAARSTLLQRRHHAHYSSSPTVLLGSLDPLVANNPSM